MTEHSLTGLLAQAMNYFSGVVPADRRIHPDFKYADEGWFYNDRMHDADDWMFRKDDQKVRILLNAPELPKLNDCPYIAKIGLNADPAFDFQYCAFLYPAPGVENIDNVAAWIKARSFPDASVFSYGETDRPTGQWILGSRLRRLGAAQSAHSPSG